MVAPNWGKQASLVSFVRAPSLMVDSIHKEPTASKANVSLGAVFLDTKKNRSGTAEPFMSVGLITTHLFSCIKLPGCRRKSLSVPT